MVCGICDNLNMKITVKYVNSVFVVLNFFQWEITPDCGHVRYGRYVTLYLTFSLNSN